MEDVSAAANRVNPELRPAADPDGPPPDTCVSHSQDPGVFAAHPSRASDTLELQNRTRVTWQINFLQLRVVQRFRLIYHPA